MKPVDDRALAEEASNDLPTDADPDDDSVLVRGTIENGTATAVADRPPVDEELPFRHEGRFYAVDYEENGTRPGYDLNVLIDYNASSVDGEVADYADLPAVDRRALAYLVERDWPDEVSLKPGYDLGDGAIYTEDEAASSVLAPDQEYDAVRYEGEVYAIDVETEEQTLTVYRYEATKVAASHEAYAADLRDRYEWELSGLNESERGLVEESLNDTHYVEESDDAAFDSLVDRFRAHEAVEETDYRGSYVVRYDGRLYWAAIDFGSYVTDSDES